MENTYHFDACLISNAKDVFALKGYEKHYLVKSRSSGFVFCSRIPTEKELSDHYMLYTREDYLSDVTIKRFNELLDGFEPYRQTNKILDIGCGVGFLMEQAKKRGWEVYGTEYTQNAIEICEAKGIKMKKGKLDPDQFAPGAFDIITSLEVMEHINNPIEEIKNIHKLLRPNGLFYFTTPNFNAVERFLLKDQYNVIEYPEHLCYYTPKTANYLLTTNGFKRKRILTSGFSLTRIKTSTKRSDEKHVSAASTDEIIRNKLEGNILLKGVKAFINGCLNSFNVGNSLKGWYIKR